MLLVACDFPSTVVVNRSKRVQISHLHIDRPASDESTGKTLTGADDAAGGDTLHFVFAVLCHKLMAVVNAVRLSLNELEMYEMRSATGNHHADEVNWLFFLKEL